MIFLSVNFFKIILKKNLIKQLNVTAAFCFSVPTNQGLQSLHSNKNDLTAEVATKLSQYFAKDICARILKEIKEA